MARTKFRIRAKPKHPKKRGEISRFVDITYTATLSDALEQVRKINPNIDPSDIRIVVEMEYGYGFGCCDDGSAMAKLTWHEEEPEEDYEASVLKPYQVRLKKYNTWYDENTERIEEEIAIREVEAKTKEKTSREKKIKQLGQELKKLEKIRRKLEDE